MRTSTAHLSGLGVFCAGFLALLLVMFWASPAAAQPGHWSDPVAVHTLRLSPDGQRMAAITQNRDSYALRISAPDQKPGKSVFSTSAAIRNIYWLSDRRLLLALDAPGRSPWLLALERNGLARQQLTPALWPKDRRQGAQLVDLLADDPMHVLISLDADRAWQPNIYRINVFTGERSLVERNSGATYHWITDRSGRVRVRSEFAAIRGQLIYSHYWRAAGSDDWRPFFSHRLGTPGLMPLMFDLDNRNLIVASDQHGPTRAIYHYDLQRAHLGQLIFGHPQADVESLLWSGLQRRPALVAFNTAMPQQVFLDQGWQQWGERLQELLPRTHNRLVSLDAAETQAIVLAYSDRDPGSFYHFRIADGRLTRIARRLPGVDPQQSATTRPVNIPVRDGLRLEGYLVRPKDTAGPTPLVVQVHGGPWTRDTWGYDPLVQELAARGMSVLKVNYRGSRGLGRDLLMAGAREWGRAMQDDLADAADWAVKQRLAESGKICILGQSYGGYAALMGVLREQDPFVCAVSYAPVTDLAAHIARFRDNGNLRGYAEWQAMVGDPELDASSLAQISPLTHADGLRHPVLLVHGLKDRIVPADNSRRFAEAAGQPERLTYLRLPDNGHDLSHANARRRYFQAAATFLSDHLVPNNQAH